MKKKRRRRKRSKKGTLPSCYHTPQNRKLRWWKKENCKLVIGLAHPPLHQSQEYGIASHSNKGEKESLFSPILTSPVNDEYFWINNPANRTPQKKPNLHPSLLSVHPSIDSTLPSKMKAKPTHEKKAKINDLQESCDETKFHPIPFYSTTNEKRTIDPLPAISRRRRFENKKSIKEKGGSASSTCLYVVHTYIHTWYLPTIHTWGHSVHYLSKKQKKRLWVIFWIFFLTKSQRGKEKKRKGKKKRRRRRKRKTVSYSTYIGTLVFSFFFFFFFSKDQVYWYTGTCRYLPTLYPASTYLPFLR